jgi:hypothetical protein
LTHLAVQDVACWNGQSPSLLELVRDELVNLRGLDVGLVHCADALVVWDAIVARQATLESIRIMNAQPSGPAFARIQQCEFPRLHALSLKIRDTLSVAVLKTLRLWPRGVTKRDHRQYHGRRQRVHRLGDTAS